MTALVVDVVEAPRVRLEEIYDHPRNPRRAAVATSEMVESIRQQGVLDPLMVAPRVEGTGWTLIDGHRRKNGALLAGLTEVPVNPRYDLVTEAQQIQVMAITGVQKENLSAVEEADCYEQLALEGMDEAAIAEATGFSKARVRSRMRLNDLSAATRDGLHDGQLTLGDAEAMLEFAGDAAATAELEEAVGTGNFRFRVQDLKQRRVRTADHQAMVEGFVDLGAAHTGPDVPAEALARFPGDLTEASAHPQCLGYRTDGDLSSWAAPYLVCRDPSAHQAAVATETATPDELRRQSDWEKGQAAREAAQARMGAASAARLEWLVEHFESMFPARSHHPLTAAARALIPILVIGGGAAPDTLADALGLSVVETPISPGERDSNLTQHAAYAAAMATASPTKVLAGFGRYLAAVVADCLDADPMWLDDPDELLHHLTLWDWLKAAGYQLNDVDVETRTRMETKLLTQAGGNR